MHKIFPLNINKKKEKMKMEEKKSYETPEIDFVSLYEKGGSQEILTVSTEWDSGDDYDLSGKWW